MCVCVCARVYLVNLPWTRCLEVATHLKAVDGRVPGLDLCLEPAEAPARPVLSAAQAGPGRG